LPVTGAVISGGSANDMCSGFPWIGSRIWSLKRGYPRKLAKTRPKTCDRGFRGGRERPRGRKSPAFGKIFCAVARMRPVGRKLRWAGRIFLIRYLVRRRRPPDCHRSPRAPGRDPAGGNSSTTAHGAAFDAEKRLLCGNFLDQTPATASVVEFVPGIREVLRPHPRHRAVWSRNFPAGDGESRRRATATRHHASVRTAANRHDHGVATSREISERAGYQAWAPPQCGHPTDVETAASNT
jgi:hypothetical protein